MFPTNSLTTPPSAAAAVRPATSVGNRVHAAMELIAVVAVLEVGMWEVCGTLDPLFRIVSLPLVAVVVWRSHRRRARMLATHDARASHSLYDTAAQAWLKAVAVTFGLGLLIPVLALVLRGEGEGFRSFWLEKGSGGLVVYLAGKGAFVVVQQLLLQYFLGPCCAELIPQRQAARAVAAIVFGLVHLPSWLLVAITTFAAYCWLSLFARGRRILPLAVSHLALAVLAHATLPERLTLNMRVGAPAQQLAERYRVPLSPQLAPHFRQLCSDRYFVACGGTEDAFLRGLYRDVLLRAQPASDEELAAWRRKLEAHARTDIVVEFFNSQEFAGLVDTQGVAAVTDQMEYRLGVALVSRAADHGMR